MVNLQFSVTGFYQPSSMTVKGPAVLFSAHTIEEAKKKAFQMLCDLSQKHPDKYPDPNVRTDWEEVFFHHLSEGENPAMDLAFPAVGTHKINSYVKSSGGPRKSPPIFFTPTDESPEGAAKKILHYLHELGYRSFPNPGHRPDFFTIFVEKA